MIIPGGHCREDSRQAGSPQPEPDCLRRGAIAELSVGIKSPGVYHPGVIHGETVIIGAAGGNASDVCQETGASYPNNLDRNQLLRPLNCCPTWPLLLFPHAQTVPSFLRARLCALPAEIAVIFVSPLTANGSQVARVVRIVAELSVSVVSQPHHRAAS